MRPSVSAARHVWASGAADQRIFILRHHRLTVVVSTETDRVGWGCRVRSGLCSALVKAFELPRRHRKHRARRRTVRAPACARGPTIAEDDALQVDVCWCCRACRQRADS
jgi:hypothetical protein